MLRPNNHLEINFVKRNLSRLKYLDYHSHVKKEFHTLDSEIVLIEMHLQEFNEGRNCD